MMSLKLFDLGFMLMILGIVITFGVAMLLILRGKGKARGGGLIMIGPFPIIFGSDSKTVKALIIVAVVFMAIYFCFSLLSEMM